MVAVSVNIVDDFQNLRIPVDPVASRLNKSVCMLSNAGERFVTSIEKKFGSCDNIPSQYKERVSEIASLIQFFGHEENIYDRSSLIFPNISNDKANTIEIMGLTRTSKAKQTCYVLHDLLAELMAFLSKENPRVIKENLIKKCDKNHLEYAHVSRALCLCDKHSIGEFPLDILMDISPRWDKCIMSLLSKPNHIKYSSILSQLHIDAPNISQTSRVTTYIVYELLSLQQELLKFIAVELNKYDYHLASKGTSNIVYNSSLKENMPVVELDIAGRYTMPVRRLMIHRYEYPWEEL